MRAKQLDGPNAVAWGPSVDPSFTYLSVLLSAMVTSASGWVIDPSMMFVLTPGCYGVQVDGTSFSETIVFPIAAPSS